MKADYIAKRLGIFLLVVVVAVTLNFLIPRLMPGDPIQEKLAQMAVTGGVGGADFRTVIEEYQRKFGLDQPLWKQYVRYWGDLLQGDLGYSISLYPARVSDLIASSLPWTVGLLTMTTLLSFSLGTVLGALLAWPKAPRLAANVFIPVSMIFSSVPYYLLAVVLLFLFSLTFEVLPSGGAHAIGMTLGLNLESIGSVLRHAILPSLSIILASLGSWALGMRGMMVTVLGEDFITLAEAKGLRPLRIFFRYGMRNAIVPQTTALAITIGHIVSGAILVEVIFRYPGVGFLLYGAVRGKDYFLLQSILLLLIVSIALSLLIIDVIYPLIDPRIRYQRG